MVRKFNLIQLWYLLINGQSISIGISGRPGKRIVDWHYAKASSKYWDQNPTCLLSYIRAVGTQLTHWGRVTHICVNKLTIIDSDNGLSPDRRQAIIWTNAGILLIGPLGTNFGETLIGIHIFSIKEMQLKMSSANWRPFCLGINELTLHARRLFRGIKLIKYVSLPSY